MMEYSVTKSASGETSTNIEKFALFAIAVSILWPRYIFTYVPGLPSVNPFTITCLLVVIMEFYSRVFGKVNSIENREFRGLIIFFIFWCFVTSLFGDAPSESLSSLLRYLVYTVSFLFLGQSIAKSPQHILTAYKVIVICALCVFGFGIYEYASGTNIFSGIINMQGDEETVKRLMQIQAEKFRDDSLRIQSVFSHPLVFTQFSAALAPIALHFFKTGKKYWRVIGAISLLLCILSIYLSGGRTGLVAVFLGILFYVLVSKGSRGGLLTAVKLTSALIAILLLIMLYTTILELFAGRTAGDAGSTDARFMMFYDTVSALSSSPFMGFGHGLAIEKAGIQSQFGFNTIDGLYFNIALDYGYIGILLFFGLVLVTLKAAISHETDSLLKDDALRVAGGASIFTLVVSFATLSIGDLMTLFWLQVPFVLSVARK